MELKFLWERYVTANARCSEVESQKQAKSETKVCNKLFRLLLLKVWYLLLELIPASVYQLGISKRMKEKANERDLADHELSNLNLSHIDERERSFVCPVPCFLVSVLISFFWKKQTLTHHTFGFIDSKLRLKGRHFYWEKRTTKPPSVKNALKCLVWTKRSKLYTVRKISWPVTLRIGWSWIWRRKSLRAARGNKKKCKFFTPFFVNLVISSYSSSVSLSFDF